MPILVFSMGEALDMAAVTDAWVAMLRAPQRPSPGAWGSEREPSLRRLSAGARRLEISADVRLGLLRDEAALLVDGLLAPVARGRGALDLAIGEGLGALAQGDRVLRLGFVSIGDYAREKLGVGARAAQGMAQLSRELSQRPLLREAVLRGEVGARKALAVLRAALDGDDRVTAAGCLGALLAYLIQVQFAFSTAAVTPIVWLLAGAVSGWTAESRTAPR